MNKSVQFLCKIIKNSQGLSLTEKDCLVFKLQNIAKLSQGKEIITNLLLKYSQAKKKNLLLKIQRNFSVDPNLEIFKKAVHLIRTKAENKINKI